MLDCQQTLEKNVTNWTLSVQRLRFTVTCRVAYRSVVRHVMKLLRRAVDEHPRIRHDALPDVFIQQFCDSAFEFRTDFWLDIRQEPNWLRVMSEVRVRIDELFREAGIVFALPQRDLHVDVVAPVRVEGTDPAAQTGHEGATFGATRTTIPSALCRNQGRGKLSNRRGTSYDDSYMVAVRRGRPCHHHLTDFPPQTYRRAHHLAAGGFIDATTGTDTMRTRLLTAAALAVTVGLAACTHMPAAETRHSGFLGDYSRLVNDPVWPNSEYWVKPGLKAAQQYDKVVRLEPAVFHANEATARATASRTPEIEQMLSYLNQALRRELSAGGYRVVSAPQPRSMRIRPAVTGLARTEADPSAMEYIPIGFVIGQATRAGGMRDESLRIFFETEVRDGETDELLAQSVSAATGGGVAPAAKVALKDTYPALDAWAKQVRERLDHSRSQ
ncbi:MAG: DUF3313 family protein [Thauera sp.]